MSFVFFYFWFWILEPVQLVQRMLKPDQPIRFRECEFRTEEVNICKWVAQSFPSLLVNGNDSSGVVLTHLPVSRLPSLASFESSFSFSSLFPFFSCPQSSSYALSFSLQIISSITSLPPPFILFSFLFHCLPIASSSTLCHACVPN